MRAVVPSRSTYGWSPRPRDLAAELRRVVVEP